MRQGSERGTGTGLVSWVRMQKKAEPHGCGSLTREDRGFVASLWRSCYC